MERANKQVDQYRLTQAFSTFKPGEPLAVTKQRMDIAKGFKDTSEEGNDLRMLGMINQSENPDGSFSITLMTDSTPPQISSQNIHLSN
jgi:hypothetical protein